jgi:16S rRNA (cytosine967-C5)-methyltransferase
MSKYHSYINSSVNIIDHYKGEVPLAIHLKKHFNAAKKYGSKDRKQIASLCYNYYRVILALRKNTVEENVIIATFLCENRSEIIENLKPEWSNNIGESINEKNSFLGNILDEKILFKFPEFLSEAIPASEYARSFVLQPNLFIRIRPGFKINVLGKLTDSFLKFEVKDTCVSFANGTKLDEILKVGEEVIIQDYSSQLVGSVIEKYIKNLPVSIWDCCAASGGKSIMMYDINPKIELTVSDVRQSILDNLSERFKLAGIKKYNSKLIDLASDVILDIHNTFDIILADVPCTGSGTWARTPEQNYFFEKSKILEYTDLQFSIVQKSLKLLKKGGILVYITCSVFKQENEGQVAKIVKENNLELLSQQMLVGYEKQADTMYIAVLKK